MISTATGLPLADVPAVIKGFVSGERFRHALAVRETANDLYSAWNPDGSQGDLLARVALIHDIGKEMGAADLREAVEKGWISFGIELLDTPSLVHAPLSAAYAKHLFGIDDPRALRAIAYHPTGHPDFDDLGLALFLADYLEPTRAFENKRESLLALAKQEPYQAALKILEEKFHYVRLKKREIHPVALAFEQSVRRRLERGD